MTPWDSLVGSGNELVPVILELALQTLTIGTVFVVLGSGLNGGVWMENEMSGHFFAITTPAP